MRELDQTVFRAINQGPEWLDVPMLFLSEGNKWWWVRIALLALFVFFLWRPKLRTPAWLAMVAWPVANAACDFLKYGLQAKRPSVDFAEAVCRKWGNEPILCSLAEERWTSFGTASAHSATMMSIAVVFMFFDKRVGIAWSVVAVLTGISRIYVGAHYPSQVVFGWAVGAFIAFVAVKSYRAFIKVRSARSDPDVSHDATL